MSIRNAFGTLWSWLIAKKGGSRISPSSECQRDQSYQLLRRPKNSPSRRTCTSCHPDSGAVHSNQYRQSTPCRQAAMRWKYCQLCRCTRNTLQLYMDSSQRGFVRGFYWWHPARSNEWRIFHQFKAMRNIFVGCFDLTCSHPLKLNPSDCNFTDGSIFACVLASSIMIEIRFATSGMPSAQWFVPGPVIFDRIVPFRSQITAFECVAPLWIKKNRNRKITYLVCVGLLIRIPFEFDGLVSMF